MFCKNCGTEIIEGSNLCHNCGTQVETDTSSSEITIQAPTETVAKFSSKAIAGFVLSLVGIIVAALPCGIIGLVFFSLGIKETRLPQYKGSGLAIAGLIISIIDILFGIIYLGLH